MKPFITTEPRAVGGLVRLGMQFDGVRFDELPGLLLGSRIGAYCVPKNQSLKAAWLLRLMTTAGLTLEFSSACTRVDGWQEIGSLNLRAIRGTISDSNAGLFLETRIDEFQVGQIARLLYQNNCCIADSGIVMTSSTGANLTVAAGVAPGSVTALIPGLSDEFDPEFSPDDYRTVAWFGGSEEKS